MKWAPAVRATARVLRLFFFFPVLGLIFVNKFLYYSKTDCLYTLFIPHWSFPVSFWSRTVKIHIYKTFEPILTTTYEQEMP